MRLRDGFHERHERLAEIKLLSDGNVSSSGVPVQKRFNSDIIAMRCVFPQDGKHPAFSRHAVRQQTVTASAVDTVRQLFLTMNLSNYTE